MLYHPAEIGFGGAAGAPPVDGAIQPGASVLFAQAIAALRRRRLPLLLCAIGVPLIVGLALLRVEPRYTASGSVLYEPRNYTDSELQSILRPDPITDEVIVSQAELIRTSRAAERLVDRFHLMARPDFNRTLRPTSAFGLLRQGIAGLAADLGIGSDTAMSPDAVRRDVIEQVQEAISVTPLRNSHVLGVSFTSPDPDLSADAVNALMEFYISDQLQGKFEAVRSAGQWLETQAQQLKKTVSDDEQKIAAYKAHNGFTPGMVAGLSAEDVSHLGDQLVAARSELATAEARLDAARGHAGVAAQAAITPGVQSLRNSADTLNAQLHSLLATYGPNMPAVIRLREQVAQAYRAVDAEIGRSATAADADARAARAKVAALQQSLQTAQAQSSAQAQAQVPLDAMEREAEASRALLQSVLAGIQRVSQQAAIERSDAKIVSPATRPSSPSFPKTGLLLGASVLFGCCLGVLLVYLLEIADATLGASEEVRRRLGIPCLALIPHIADQNVRITGRDGAMVGSAIGRAVGAQSRGGQDGREAAGGIDDYVVRKPRSHFAEQIRAVRAAFWFASHEPRTVAITSARPGEGKTTTAIALGRSAALNGERVIVVDCDIRQPSLGEGPGLSDYLRGEVRLADVTHRDPLTALFFVPVGTPSESGGGPFMTEGMARVLAELKQHYDLVILDSPPVLAMTDARVIARIADTTLLCVRWRDTPHSVAGRSLAMLQDAQAHVAGAILTRIDPRALVGSGLADAEMYDPRYSGYYRD